MMKRGTKSLSSFPWKISSIKYTQKKVLCIISTGDVRREKNVSSKAQTHGVIKWKGCMIIRVEIMRTF